MTITTNSTVDARHDGGVTNDPDPDPTVLRDPSYRSAAKPMADEARSLPGSDRAAALLEAMVQHASAAPNDNRQQR